MDHIRLATPEEVEKIKGEADLGQQWSVLAMDNAKGSTNLAVVKRVVEMDPVFFSEDTSDGEKARFIWGLEERLMGANEFHYYFNVKADDERWQKVVQHWGAIRQSATPEIRFGKPLRK